MDNKVSSNPVERLMENYSKINHDEKFNEEYEYDGIYMFFSFDLVNSTQFKTKYKNKWPIVFDEFYTNITKAMIEQVNGSVVWKYIGDEVLFYKKIDCKKDLFIHLPTLLKIKTDVMDKINKKVNESRGNLYLKTCVWIASARHIPFDTMNKEEVNEYENLIRFNDQNPRYNFYSTMDFIGTDIDSGFRISKHVDKNKIIIGAKLACCIYKLYEQRDPMESKLKEAVEERLKIVTYERLKGIWNDRYYPIIWYNDCWDDPDKLLYYDDRYNSNIIKENYERIINNKLEGISKIGKIFNDLNKTYEIEKIMEVINNLDDEAIPIETLGSRYDNNCPLTEVHCVAICINRNNQVLVAKRNKSKNYLPNTWEFGCGKLKFSETWESCLKRSYKENFNIDLDFRDRLIPVNTYNINKSDKIIAGVIFAVRVEDNLDVKISSKYEEFKWINQSSTDLKGENCVEDLERNISLAKDILSYNEPVLPHVQAAEELDENK